LLAISTVTIFLPNSLRVFLETKVKIKGFADVSEYSRTGAREFIA